MVDERLRIAVNGSAQDGWSAADPSAAYVSMDHALSVLQFSRRLLADQTALAAVERSKSVIGRNGCNQLDEVPGAL